MTYLALFLLAISCSSNKSNTNESQTNDSVLNENEKTEVKVMPLQYSSFKKEIISNGKLVALKKADLRFRTSENVAKIYVNNGDYVNKGKIIAKLEDFNLVNALNQSREQFEKALIDLQDILIGQGFSIKDTAILPKETIRAAHIKSGYDRALYNLEIAQYNLEASELKSPFNGVVANLFSKENNIPMGERFCTIIDNSKFEAEFTILENELALVKKGQLVRIVPFAFEDVTDPGIITQINPVIDQNGMARVKAICSNLDNKLTEGMNVKIVIEDNLANQLVIPKQAVVLRNEKQIVFTLSEGSAKWNYVKTSLENSTSFVVSEGLKAGDTLIIEGNINLAHDAEVKVVK
jgi:RND family efflux transporter MFP subunit